MVENLAQWVDRKVIVTHNLDEPNAEGHTCEETEGVVTVANPGVGVVLKPTGKTMVKLIKAKDIEDIVLAPTTLRVFKQKVIREVGLDTVRQHLLDRHGVTLTTVNGADEKRCLQMHGGADHSDLGHSHALTVEGDA